MTWEQYEIWAVIDGHEELIDTTKSKKEAQQLAHRALSEGAESVKIFRETDDGDYDLVEEITP